MASHSEELLLLEEELLDEEEEEELLLERGATGLAIFVFGPIFWINIFPICNFLRIAFSFIFIFRVTRVITLRIVFVAHYLGVDCLC